MLRSIRVLLACSLISLISAPTVRAQGWGWEGWGGWTTTPEAAFAQGMGTITRAQVFLTKGQRLRTLSMQTH